MEATGKAFEDQAQSLLRSYDEAIAHIRQEAAGADAGVRLKFEELLDDLKAGKNILQKKFEDLKALDNEGIEAFKLGAQDTLNELTFNLAKAMKALKKEVA